MTIDSASSFSVFISHTHEDRAFADQLNKHLSFLQGQDLVSIWHDLAIMLGSTDWDQAIDAHLKSASVILLLISSDFLASNYCYGFEMQQALKRAASGSTHATPIPLRPTDWQSAPFAHLQVLPMNGQPITRRSDLDTAFQNIIESIRELLFQRVESLERGQLFHEKLRYEREKRGCSIADLAEKINVNSITVHRWKTGQVFPLSAYRQKLCELFGMDAVALGLLPLPQELLRTYSMERSAARYAYLRIL